MSLIVARALSERVDFPMRTSAVAALTAAGVLVVAALATWVPARRAASVDPAALKAE